MIISEYTLLEGAFDNSWGSMLNRIDEWLDSAGLDPLPESVRESDYLRERAFVEFMAALEEMGVKLEEVEGEK